MLAAQRPYAALVPGSLIGTEVLRVEDPDLLTGRARYVDDLPIDGILVMRFVRSPVAHARVAAVDVAPALDVPGVVAAFSAADLGLGETPAFMSVNPNCHRPPLAEDRVRFVGEPVAAVVATTSAAADDGVEAVVVDYEPLPAAVDPEAALSPGAPLLFDAVPSNLAAGERDAEPTDGAALFGDAEVVVRARIENQRVAVMPMEGDAIAVVPGPDGQGHDLTVHVSTQMPHMFWMMASRLLGMERGEIRVVAPFVGGGFGAKVGMSAEHIVVMAVARRLGRPVKWVQTRSENLVSMPHGRAQTQFVELGVRRDGTITGLRARVIGDSGAYAGFGGSLAMGPTRNMAQGVYRIPRINYAAAVAVTNTTPVGAFRGAGRPEAAAMLERIVDIAAA
jgi:carbon-monoxide dehydrogenase large subunit